jgi:hypothetical protein
MLKKSGNVQILGGMTISDQNYTCERMGNRISLGEACHHSVQNFLI